MRAALDAAARDMTTLHVREEALRSAVAQYASVAGLEVEPDFPHTLRIRSGRVTLISRNGKDWTAAFPEIAAAAADLPVPNGTKTEAAADSTPGSASSAASSDS